MDLRIVLTNDGLAPDNFPRNKNAFRRQGMSLTVASRPRMLTQALPDTATRTKLLEAYGMNPRGMTPREVRVELAAFLGLDTKTGE